MPILNRETTGIEDKYGATLITTADARCDLCANHLPCFIYKSEEHGGVPDKFRMCKECRGDTVDFDVLCTWNK